jgi:hypothetical protein
MKKQFHAWGIDLNTGEGHGLAGRYFWFNGQPPNIPPHLQGYKVALFATRKIARENLKNINRYVWLKAKVVKVTVTLEWE